ncbi:Rap1a/Tai family immunity protein [Roseibium sp.]|uniref:Rap1a/Tai family immunity protein n=1 Tax=Roseibium sp. TaxID=1936156 RepID=UPI00345C18E6
MSVQTSVAQEPSHFFMDGNKLYELCKEDHPVCIGYLMGLSDLQAVLQRDGHLPKWACTPDNLVTPQLRDIAVKHLETYPNLRHYAAPIIMLSVLRETFPCE